MATPQDWAAGFAGHTDLGIQLISSRQHLLGFERHALSELDGLYEDYSNLGEKPEEFDAAIPYASEDSLAQYLVEKGLPKTWSEYPYWWTHQNSPFSGLFAVAHDLVELPYDGQTTDALTWSLDPTHEDTEAWLDEVAKFHSMPGNPAALIKGAVLEIAAVTHLRMDNPAAANESIIAMLNATDSHIFANNRAMALMGAILVLRAAQAKVFTAEMELQNTPS